jgi:hypothetical protein
VNQAGGELAIMREACRILGGVTLMSPRVQSARWPVALIAILALCAGAYFLWRGPGAGQPHPAGGPPLAGNPIFREAASESGIAFRTHYLAGEQGANFKINLYDHGSGLAVGDYDGDGRDDIYFVNQLGPNALYRNKGDGTFEDVTEQAGVGVGDRICVSATFADYDNDGHQDLFVTSTRGGNILFRNLGNGKFKDVTKEAGLTHVGHSQAAAFFDFDNDGYLDLLVIQTAQWTTNTYDSAAKHYAGKSTLFETASSPKEFNTLYRNNRDGTFTDVTAKAGLKGRGWGADVAVFDYDGDGHLDVLVTNMFGPSQLYRNNGNGTFTEVTMDVLGRTPAGGMGAKVFDFNNDGKLDLYIVDMHSDMWTPFEYNPASIQEDKKYQHMTVPDQNATPQALQDEKVFADLIQLPYEKVAFGNTFHKNVGKGKFEEISDRARLETYWPWGIAAGDFDNDGYVDAFLPSGMGYPWFYWPNRLLMNNGDGTFTERSGQEGIEPPVRGIYHDYRLGGKKVPRSSRSAATADFDGDGRLELVVNNFNDAPYYFKNQSPQKNYVAFRLRGTKSNRDAIGALVTLHLGEEVMVRQVDPAGGYLAQSSKTVHFGLGDRAKIDRAEIRWPSGIRQVIDNPAINTLHPIVEEERGPARAPPARKD